MVRKQRVGRNAPCPCGSGKKFKRCCLKETSKSAHPSPSLSVDTEIHEAGRLSLEHSEESILGAIDKFNSLSKLPSLTSDQRKNVIIGLTTAYQHRGEHKLALDILATLEPELSHNDKKGIIYTKKLAAVSYRELGYKELSSKLFNEIIPDLGEAAFNEREAAFIHLEAGKSFHMYGDAESAKQSWEKALNYFSDNKENELEHYARTKANLGFLQLSDADYSQREKGVTQIEDSSELKRLIGDLEGLANNHCNLGLYYFKNKKYEKAIAYLRKDLYLTRKVGDIRALGTTLCNLAALYIELKQLSPARELLREALALADGLSDKNLCQKVEHIIQATDSIGKLAGQNKERLGPAAICACCSGKEYQECCGRADFEPVDIPWQFGGISQDVVDLISEAKKDGIEPSRLDFIFRDTEESRRRLAWNKIKVHDGWLEMKELPDMANRFLVSQEPCPRNRKLEPDSVVKPLSILMLSACALESFINQVCFFLSEVNSFPEARLHHIPPELANDPLSFQRNTELTKKWDILGNALCGKCWPPASSAWDEFRNVIYIRNELVHFKVSEFMLVVPEPKTPPDISKEGTTGYRDTKNSTCFFGRHDY